ncbi:MAG: hypothetical protein AAF791_08495 [Bacteroidota bacterium]
MPETPPPQAPRDRTVHKARGFEEADAWDRAQHLQMTPDERRRAARVLKLRAFPVGAPDVRACDREP